MAKKNTADRKKNLVVIRGYESWGRWLTEFADDRGLPVVMLIDQAVREMARRDGFKPPPKRY